MKKLLVVFIALTIFVGCQGCRHVNSTNPAVIKAATLLDAENTVNTIAHGLQEANATIKNMQASEPGYYTFVHPKLVEIAKLNEKANAAIVAAKNGDASVDWRKAVVDVAKAAGNTSTLTSFGFKDPKTQQIVQVGFATLITALSLAGTYGGQ